MPLLIDEDRVTTAVDGAGASVQATDPPFDPMFTIDLNVYGEPAGAFTLALPEHHRE